MAAADAVIRAQNRAVAKGSDPKAATCRAKLQRARSALNRQMDRELRLREGAENLLRATTKDGCSDNGILIGGSGGCRNKSKNRKLIRQTVALELSFLDSNVRLLADELAELNGSVDVYQHRDNENDYNEQDDFHGIIHHDSSTRAADETVINRQRRRQRQMPMIAVPLKDTRPIDFKLPLERFINQHYGMDLSVASDDENKCEEFDVTSADIRRSRRPLSIRKAIDELTQLRLDTQTPSRDADGVRLLLRYYRQLYYVDRRFFPPSSTTVPITTNSRQHNQNNHYKQSQQQDHHYRQNKQQHALVTDTSSTQPSIYFEWYDSFGGPVPSCGQRTVRFEQACVLFNVAAVHTQMGAKHDRRCLNGRDDDSGNGSGRPTGSWSTSTGPEQVDGAAAAAQCFLRAAGAYRHISDTFANAPARAADLRATGVLYALMMAQANECFFEKLQWRLLASVRHRCRRHHGNGTASCIRRKILTTLSSTEKERRGHSNRDIVAVTRRMSSAVLNDGTEDMNTTHPPSWAELAREASHVSRVYADVVYNSSSRADDVQGINENGGCDGVSPVLPDAWVSVCQIKDRHYAALAYRYAACALLPYFQCSSTDDDDTSDGDDLLNELMTVADRLEIIDDDDDDDLDETSSVTVQQRRRKQLGKILLEAAVAVHDRAARVQRLCRQLRAKVDGNNSGGSGGGGLLSGVLDCERQRTLRLLLLHRRVDNNDDTVQDCCCHRRWCDDDENDDGKKQSPKMTDGQPRHVWHDCYSDNDDGNSATVADYCAGGSDQEEYATVGIAGMPGLDVDRGVPIKPWTRFRLTAIVPDFTDTGDGDYDDDDEQRQNSGDTYEAVDLEERRADLFAGLGPVAVFSARHRFSRPRWLKLVGGARHRSPGDTFNAQSTGGNDEDDDESFADPIQLVARWFGFELRGHGGGTATTVPPATVGHVRSNSQAQQVGFKRGDIVVALKCLDNGQVLDVRWDTCRRVAELIVQKYRQRQRRRRQQSFSDGGNMTAVHLKVVTPITAPSMDPNQLHSRRRTTPTRVASHMIVSPTGLVPMPSSPTLLAQSSSKQQRHLRRQNTNGSNDINKMHTWSWNPFRWRRRNNVVARPL